VSQKLEPKLPCAACKLRARPDFKPVNADQLAWIEAQKIGQVRAEAGDSILEQLATGDRLYTILEGWAFRFKDLPDGRRQILNILLPGDLVGLQGELLAASTHGVEAVTPVLLCAFRRDTVVELYREQPALALDVTWLAALGERLSDDVLLTVGRRNALERVATLLVHLFKRATSAGLGDKSGIPFPLTQQHIADALGLSVVHTNRVLQALRRLGLIRLTEGRLAIGDLRALRRVADYWEQPAPPRPLL
jgi:CRP/FNR family transcriptional regulator, anaerobic regulatory protein